MTNLQATIQQIDQDAATLKARLVAEQQRHERELAAIAAATALQAERDADQERQQKAIAEFEAGPLADAQIKFAELHERAKQLRALVQECERMHETIATGAADLSKDAHAAVQTLVAALPGLSEFAADEALQRAGVNGLRFGLPRWLLSIFPNRWMGSGPSVNADQLYVTARQYAAQLVTERHRAAKRK